MKPRTSFNLLSSLDGFRPLARASLLLLTACAAYGAGESAEKLVVPDGNAYKGKKIIAEVYNSGFALGHDSYNAMGTGSDGKIYYVLSSDNIDQGAKMFCLDPKNQQVTELGDLTEACGEKGSKAIPQGKSHVNFVEANGKLYFATHVGVYSIVEGKETMGIPPAGYKPYPGGHLLSYDLKTSKFEDYGICPGREGVLTFNMDKKRGRLFAITWPSGIFYRYNLATKFQKEFGKMCAKGEDGVGADYRTVCRSLAVNQDDGTAYFTTSEGTIFRYDPTTDTVAPVAGEDMKKDYFGLYDPTNPGHMGYNWRQTFWRERDGLIYGVHGNSGYLFRFDPRAPRIEVLDRITSEPAKRCGMFDQFSYGYLGFALGPDGKTIHYLTGGPIYIDGKRLAGKSKTAMGEAKGLEDLHLVTYDIESGKCTDNGAVFYENGQRPLYVNAIAVGKDGMVYTLPRITENGKTRSDLVGFPGPLKKRAGGQLCTRFAGIGRLFGESALERLRRAHVCVIGLGGVGSWAVEALARSGIGELTLVDLDDVCISNVNRQLHALDGEFGKPKVEVLTRRVSAINPDCTVHAVQEFFLKSNAQEILQAPYDYVLDAIDSPARKCLLIALCREKGVPIITTGASAGRRDPTCVEVVDLAFSSHDRLLQEVRKKLRTRHGFPRGERPFGVECVVSREPVVYPRKDGSICPAPQAATDLRLDCESGFGTASFVTGTFGLVAASRIVQGIATGAALRRQARDGGPAIAGLA